MGSTEVVADFVSKTDFSSKPKEAHDRAKLALLDCLGVAIAGARFPSSLILLDFIREIGGAPQATVVGTELRTSLPDAALSNGMLASALLYDDTSHAMHGHSTATLLPIVLALGEAHHLSGRDVLEAYLVGFEVEAALGMAVDPEHYERGWHATSTIGSLGATAAACRLLSLPSDKVQMALGIATSLTGGSRQNFGTMMQAFHGGLPARNGMVAALLAKRGFTADPNILESRMGFFALFGADPNQSTAKMENFGKEMAILQPNLAMKLYPCGFPIHRPIEGTLELAAEHDLDPNEVEWVRCGVHYLIPETVFHVNPQTGLQGRTSIQYCVARALLDRRIGLAQFTDEKVQDPAVRQLMAKVRVEVPPDLSREALRGRVNSIAAPATVEIRLRDGRTFSKRVEYYRGAPERPLSHQEVVEKFRECAGSVLDSNHVEQTREMIENLENLKDAADLTALLTT